MKKFYPYFLLAAGMLCSSLLPAAAQTVINGYVVNERNEPVPGAAVFIRDAHAGTLTDSSGHFTLQAAGQGSKTLRVTALGYHSYATLVALAGTADSLIIRLKQTTTQLDDVTVSAGSFHASDKAKGASLTPIDAVTVAGNGGDVANAMRVLPGAQVIGEKEGLFVRGGSSEEAKQFVDGAWLKSPNFSSVPGMPQFARLNPFLFKGILFSTGGYSALYGQALSGALILETTDLPDKSSASFNVFPMNIGAGWQSLARDKKSSYGFTARYGNFHLYNSVVPQTPDFFHGPEYFSGDANFRIKTSRTGMLKAYINYGYSHTGMRNPDIDSTTLFSSYEVKGKNLLANLSYRESLGRRWKVDAVLALNEAKEFTAYRLLGSNKQPVELPLPPYNGKNNSSDIHSSLVQSKAVFTRSYARNQALRVGAEYFYTHDTYDNSKQIYPLTDHLLAVFVEADIRLSPHLAARAGLRTEHSSLLQHSSLAPRLSLAYKFNNGGQVNAAYGLFYQKPENNFLWQKTGLPFASAAHYILNYQKKAGNRLFRIEAYYKQYRHLITTLPDTGCQGSGHAKGIELFWRDKKTFKNIDYWITYTYLDTKRQYLDYPYAMRPGFATPHTASIAVKRFFENLGLNINLAYTFATGRPYYFISTDATGHGVVKAQGTTNTYNGLNLSFAYLTSFLKKWKINDLSGIGAGINNVFGTTQVFGYYYSADGANRRAITLPATRSYYIGIFMSLGVDRRDDFINENL